jgi:hypothetical protein
LEKTTSGGFADTQEHRYKNNVCKLINNKTTELNEKTAMIIFKLNIKDKKY